MKQNLSKRILSLALAAMMVMGIFAMTVPAAAAGSAYVYSYNQLKDSLEDPNITDVYVIVGDLHSYGSSFITYDLSDQLGD